MKKMAHSAAATAITASAATTTGEINYFFQDEHGQILNVLKRADIKQEPMGQSELYANNKTLSGSNQMGTYNQMSTSNQATQFVRLPNSYNVQAAGATYTIITPQNGSVQQQQHRTVGGIKYEAADDFNGIQSTVVKSEDRYIKYTPSKTKTAKPKIQTQPATASNLSSSIQRKRKPEKAGKGLRHFSMKVCKKVKEKGTTTYNEVADELVAEEMQNNPLETANCDQKNIRRRVYDALNVLMAMDIIAKDKKEIRWIGLPSSSHEQCDALQKEYEERRERIKQKHQQLQELLLQQVSFKSLTERNREAERRGIVPTPNSSVQLPFIIVNTHKMTKINCSVTNDKSEYIFKFDDAFEMHDDAEVLKRMGLLYGLDKGECSTEDIERAKSLVPPNFEKYIEAYGNGRGNGCGDSDDEITGFAEYNDDSNSAFAHNTAASNVVTAMNIKKDLEDDEFIENSDID